jgi:glycosyltransferase involved in cell wall biosynthesis
VGIRTGLRQVFGPVTLPSAARCLENTLQRIKPDLVHAMRVPYEGMLAALARPRPPLLISIWGNDFTLHARSNPWMASLTRLALRRASALHTDCRRDLRLAGEWGFPAARPSVILPGGGGVQPQIFYPPDKLAPGPVAINPRGFRAYVRNDTFFRSIPLILQAVPQARFLCPGMALEPQAGSWVAKLGIGQAVDLLPAQPRPALAELFRKSQVLISPSTHDGTPNTLLEALACGCFPVVGDMESLREWVRPGENGFLVDPASPQALAEAVIRALKDPDLRLQAAQINARLIAERAEYYSVMRQAEDFYHQIL